MADALLNPQIELDGARFIIQLTSDKLREIEYALTHAEMKHEEYLKHIGAAVALRGLLQDQETNYNRMVNK